MSLSPIIPKITTNIIAVKISTNGYCQEIFCWQFLHLPFKKIKLKTGISSYHERVFLHFGQKDLPKIVF